MICLAQDFMKRIFFFNIYSTDIPQFVYVTKMDKVCSFVQMDPSFMFHSKAVSEIVNKTSDVIGLPRGHDHPNRNYESETTLDTNFDILLLQAS